MKMLLATKPFERFVAALLVLFVTTSATAKTSDDFVPEEMVCQVSYNGYIDSINTYYGTQTVSYLSEINSYLLQSPPGLDAESLAEVISMSPEVVYCDANYILSAPEPVQGSQPFIDGVAGGGEFRSQPATATTNLAAAQSVSTGTAVKVGVIDVGINLTHPELTTVAASAFDFVDADSVATDDPGGSASGHGTFIAGVINLVAPDAEIRAYRVLDTAGKGNGYDIARAILSAIDDGCKVINLSLVMTAKHGSIDAAIEYAKIQNVLVVAAAGNDSSDVDRFPARDSYTLSVAAVDTLNLKADFSNFGGHVDVCAPGTHILAPFLDSTYAYWDGTSFATPFVAGQAALLYAANPAASWNDVVNAITTTAVSIDDINPLYAGQLGFGLIDPAAALAVLGLQCGDLNGDAIALDPVDLTYLVDFLFTGGPAPVHTEAADLDGNGDPADPVDLSLLVDYLFSSGLAPTCPAM